MFKMVTSGSWLILASATVSTLPCQVLELPGDEIQEKRDRSLGGQDLPRRFFPALLFGGKFRALSQESR